MNSVLLIGRVVRKPDLSYTQTGKAVARFTLAVDRRGRDKGVDFINCTAWEKDAENIGRYMDKGRQMAIKGHIQTSSYERNGQKVFKTEVVVDNAEFLGKLEEAQEYDDFDTP